MVIDESNDIVYQVGVHIYEVPDTNYYRSSLVARKFENQEDYFEEIVIEFDDYDYDE